MLLLLVSFVAPAWAASCTMTNPSIAINAQTTIRGSITVGPDAPVGSVLYHARYWSTTPISLNCPAGNFYTRKQYFSLPHPTPVPGVTSQRGQAVYPTSIPGIGVYVWSNDEDLPVNSFFGTYTNNWSTTLTGGGSLSAFTSFDVYLIKTAAGSVGAGTISGSDLPIVAFSFGDPGALPYLGYLVGSFVGSVSVVAQTCQTPSNLTVPMGTHLTTELKGQGTTTNTWVPVDIALTNCPAFFGYRGTTTDVRNATPVTDFNIRSNSIFYSVNPSYGVANASNGVMNLAPGGATGIGVQLTNTSGAAVRFNTSTDSNLNLLQTAGQRYTIGLQARYYQTGTSITAGAANSTATVTLTYN
ncbi:fimbrial protein [Dyella sp. GSA-30]|nr:fimbrial protein [Dyella sp. GSA-30]